MRGTVCLAVADCIVPVYLHIPLRIKSGAESETSGLLVT